MPVRKVGKKYAIGKGKAMYTSKAKAGRAYAAYRAKKHDTIMNSHRRRRHERH